MLVVWKPVLPGSNTEGRSYDLLSQRGVALRDSGNCCPDDAGVLTGTGLHHLQWRCRERRSVERQQRRRAFGHRHLHQCLPKTFYRQIRVLFPFVRQYKEITQWEDQGR